MVWNLIVPIVSRYTTVLTLPVAIGKSMMLKFDWMFCILFYVVIGGVGYYIERRLRGVPHTPVPHEKAIIEERSDRYVQQQPIASPYRMDTILPKTIFERNNPEELRKLT